LLSMLKSIGVRTNLEIHNSVPSQDFVPYNVA
jgi:hypothetical protein